MKEIIIETVSRTFGLIIIIPIIVCDMKRKTNTKNRRDQTGNNSGNPQHVSRLNEHRVDYGKSYNSGNPERVSMAAC